MEGLGVAASIVAVVDISTTVIAWCGRYVSGVKDAKGEKGQLLHEVTELYYISQKVKDLIDGPYGPRLKASSSLSHAIKDGEAKLNKLKVDLSTSRFHGIRGGSGIASLVWPFKAEEARKIIQDLARCTQMISLALEVDQM